MIPLIEAQGIEVRHDSTRVLHDVNLSIKPGEIVTVVGPNGSGKSTLMRTLVGAITPNAGKIVRNPQLRIGYVPQKLAVDRTLPMTVDRFLRMSGAGPDTRARVAKQVGISGLGWRQLAELSGGQFQRAALARALLRNPTLLALDEPTQGLDQPGIASFYKLIEKVRQETRCAVLLISHDLHVVMSASDRVICLNGHVCCEGTPTVVSEAPEYRAMFGYGTGGALALYRHHHHHDHHHHTPPAPVHDDEERRARLRLVEEETSEQADPASLSDKS